MATPIINPYTPATNTAIQALGLKKLMKIIPPAGGLDYIWEVVKAINSGQTHSTLLSFFKYRPEFSSTWPRCSSHPIKILTPMDWSSEAKYSLTSETEFTNRYTFHPRTMPLIQHPPLPQRLMVAPTTITTTPALCSMSYGNDSVAWIPYIVALMHNAHNDKKPFSKLILPHHLTETVKNVLKDIAAAKQSKLTWVANPFMMDYFHKCVDEFPTAYPEFKEIIDSVDRITTTINDASKIVTEATREREEMISKLSSKLF